eukprot:2203395-Prorocentrum_lima.AAC.1
MCCRSSCARRTSPSACSIVCSSCTSASRYSSLLVLSRRYSSERPSEATAVKGVRKQSGADEPDFFKVLPSESIIEKSKSKAPAA